MNESRLKTIFPRASQSFLRLNTDTPTKLESNSGNGTLGAKKIQRPTGERFLVRVTSIRKRLLDEDNLCEKYHVDLCRYAGILPDDAPGTVKIEVGQRKANKGEPEQTIIEVFSYAEV